ncbi:hypothetical protein O3P69_005816 [Scylla paramamosain]|uniref:DNA topoisomerase (ATP-hydrolyzing) n=1 Tax=Scylla paramamosain TaxID=85552 RepID=A0AAW0U8V3_SCYPA
MAVNEEFWQTLDNFRATILYSGDLEAPATVPTRSQDHSREVVKRCEGIIEGVVASLARGEPPVLRVPRPQSQVYRLVGTDSYATRRDAFYEFVWLYKTQSTLDRVAEDLTRLLGVPRRALHLTATGKGLVAGCLRYTTHDGTLVDASQASNGVGVPECVAGLTDIQTDSRYVLVVEKDATFQKLLETHFLRSFGPAILVTGKGYPDLNTRQLVFRLRRDLQLPVLALTDADPYGLHIAAVYKFGALAREESGLSVGSLAWLGVLPTDLRSLQLPAHALLPLTPKDHGKLASLAAHPALSRHPAWLRQIEEQFRIGCKAEIQGLTHVAPDYLTITYLPTKLKMGGWVA